jgi:ATP-binding cassette subfamily B protein
MLKNINIFFETLKLNRKKEFLYLLCLVLICSCIEVISIGSVIPFLSIMFNENSHGRYSEFLTNFLSLRSSQDDDYKGIVVSIFVLGTVFSGLFRVLVLKLSTQLTFRTATDISLKIYENSINQSYEEYLTTTSSELISAIVTKVNAVVYSFLMQAINLVVSIIISISILMTLMIINLPVSCLVFLSFLILYYPILRITKISIGKDSKIVSKLSIDMVQCIQETHGAYRDLLVNGSKYPFIEKFKNIDIPLRDFQGRIIFLSTYPRYIVEMLGIIIIISISFYYVSIGTPFIQIFPTLVAVGLASQRLLPLVQQAYSAWANMQMSKIDFQEIIKILCNNNEQIKESISKNISYENSIKFTNVSYKYPGAQDFALTNISFEISAGDRIGIIGETGSGKTTLIDLLMGLLLPTQGEIIVDGEVLDDEKRVDWRSHIALVPQSIFLFNRTIGYNITLKNKTEELSDRLKLAVRIARLENLIAKLSGGISYVVGERGNRLSGGEKQRIGIARAIFKDSALIIMDEGTSALDGDTESKVMKELFDYQIRTKEMTIVMIAHRLSSLKDCNKIYKLQRGLLVEVSNDNGIVK